MEQYPLPRPASAPEGYSAVGNLVITFYVKDDEPERYLTHVALRSEGLTEPIVMAGFDNSRESVSREFEARRLTANLDDELDSLLAGGADEDEIEGGLA